MLRLSRSSDLASFAGQETITIKKTPACCWTALPLVILTCPAKLAELERPDKRRLATRSLISLRSLICCADKSFGSGTSYQSTLIRVFRLGKLRTDRPDPIFKFCAKHKYCIFIVRLSGMARAVRRVDSITND